MSLSMDRAFSQFNIEYVHAGELLEQAAPALHRRFAASGPMSPRPSTAIQLRITDQIAARVYSNAVDGSA